MADAPDGALVMKEKEYEEYEEGEGSLTGMDFHCSSH